MKKFAKVIALVTCVAVCVAVFTACSENAGKSKILGSPAKVKEFSYTEWDDEGFLNIVNQGGEFADRLSEAVYKNITHDGNIAVSPIAVYMALALAAECTGGETREELVSALGLNYGELVANIGKLYRSLSSERTDDRGKLMEKLALTNSIWVDESTATKQATIDNLAKEYFCYSYAADFAGDNKNANAAVRKFIKDQTNKLIDQDWNLSTWTRFALVTTLYLKDVWNLYGDDKAFTADKYEFTAKSGKKKSLKLLQDGYRKSTRAFVTESFRAFYTSTHRNYTIRFIVPNDGYTVEDVFTAENLRAVAEQKNYNGLDDENLIRYNTRCFFPEFKADYNGNLTSVLQSEFEINKLFGNSADFSSLTDEKIYCNEVRHVTKLTVDKKGIEGAAVVVIPGAGSAAPGVNVYKDVYEDFIVDRAFGYTVSDRFGNILFSGVISNV